VFVGVLAWQVPSVLKMMNEKPPPTATPPPAAAPLPSVPVAGTPVSATPTPAGTLVDSDPAAQAAGGQLVTFDRFESKDPFQQQLVNNTPSAVKDDAPADAPANGQPGGGGSAPKPSPVPVRTTAEITVNGTRESVSVGGTFPQADPVFVLVSVTKTSAKVGVSGGSLAGGGQTVTLRKGKKLTLENTVDGARYVLVLVRTS
jgi:hypothetical protein